MGRRYGAKTERELVPDSVNAVGQILSNYQAALHLFEDAVRRRAVRSGARGPAARGRQVFAPVLDACVGVAPGLEELVEESIGEVDGERPSRARALRGRAAQPTLSPSASAWRPRTAA